MLFRSSAQAAGSEFACRGGAMPARSTIYSRVRREVGAGEWLRARWEAGSAPQIAWQDAFGAPRSGRAALVAAVILFAGLSPLAAQVAEVQLTPARFTLEAGKRKALYAAAYDRQGNLIAAPSFTFASSDTAVATVSVAGTVTGVRAGVATIEARAGARRATAAVMVADGTPAPPRVTLASLTLEPPGVALLPLEPMRLVVRAARSDAAEAVGTRVSWRSLDPRVAAVDQDGIVIGVAPGRTTIEASASGLTASAPVVVDTAVFTTPGRRTLTPGATDTILAIVPAQAGRTLRAGLRWTSSDTSIVRAGAAGDIHAVAPGEAEVVVTGYGMTGRVRVLVHRRVESFALSPRASAGPIRIPLGSSKRFEARAQAADSTPIAEAPVIWTVGDSAIASFAPETGMLTARAAGTTTLSAVLEGFAPVVWAVEVVPAAIALDRRRLGLAVGGTAVLVPSLVDDAGATITTPATDVGWTSDRPEIVSVRGGRLEALAPGRTTITAATPWGARGTAEVFVNGDLLVASNRGGTRGTGIYRLSLGGGPDFTALLSDSASNLQPALSPDRTRIAFSSNRAGTFDLYVMDADGQNVTRVTTDAGSESDPAWTPDGRRLIYTETAGGVSQLASIGIDGSDGRTLTATAGGNATPSVSPDGRTIAFATARDGNYEIYQMGSDGSAPRRLTFTREREQLPRFFPNGDLLYATDRGRGATLVRLGAAGAVTLVEVSDAIVALALSGDGSRVAYVTGRLAGRGGSRAEYSLVVRRTAGDPAPVTVPTQPGEQIATPAF